MKKALIIILVAAIVVCIIGVLKKNATVSEPYSDTSTPPEAFITTRERESISEAVRELISESRSSREEASSIVKVADAVVTTRETLTEVYAEEEDEFEHRSVTGEHGEYIGYFRLTAFEWTGDQ